MLIRSTTNQIAGILQFTLRLFCLLNALMLIGCLEREYLKNGLRSDVNSKLKSDPIKEIDFSENLDKVPVQF